MTPLFVHDTGPVRVVFGQGSIGRVRQEVERLGRGRVLVLASPRPGGPGDQLEAVLGPLAVARFGGAAAHTPLAVTESALALFRAVDADCVVAAGGGATTGLAKALAVRTGVDQVILPTTYAGSEVTPVLGETEGGRKTTRSSPAILPETVVYDVDLSRDLPLAITASSAVNALAHAVTALCAPRTVPLVDAVALDAVERLVRGLRGVLADPSDLDGRTQLLLGAWHAGTCLAATGPGVAHRLCHVLGGSFGLPHAAAHAVVLPHVVAHLLAPETPGPVRRIAAALDVPDTATGLFDLVRAAGGPTALRDLGLEESVLPCVVDATTATPPAGERAVPKERMDALLRDAFVGVRPAGDGSGTARVTA